MDNSTVPLGVYVHWPYCARICPYCDFNVYKNKGVDTSYWGSALKAELRYWRNQTGLRPLTSLYFGGGTPSLAPPQLLSDVINTCVKLWGLADDCEITIEINPDDSCSDVISDFSDMGINRASVGVQSFDEAELAFLGRNHTAAQANAALETVAKKFRSFSFDLIYGLPSQTSSDWKGSLSHALSYAPPHLSLYQLTIEPDTAFDRAVARGDWSPPSEDVNADMFEITNELPAAAGMIAYEISNHARPGHQSKHNSLYWRQYDYIGIGPGAHGRLTTGQERRATETHLSPEAYLKAVDKKGVGTNCDAILASEEQLTERLTMGLRLIDGVELYVDDPFYLDAGRVDRLQTLIRDGFLTHHCGTLRATYDGRRILNAVTKYLLLG